MDYQPNFVDNSTFPITIDYTELTNLGYTFNIDINDTLQRDQNFSINIFKDNISISTGVSYTHDFRNEKMFALKYLAIPELGYSKPFIKNIQLINYNPVLKKDFILEANYPQGITVSLDIDATDLAGNPLTYIWYVNEEEVGNGKTLKYTFQTKEPHTIKCVITNEIGGRLEISKTTSVADSVYIVDISEIKNKTLMGNYTFTVKAADALGVNLNYSWLVNGVEKSTSSMLTISFLEDGEIVNIKCLVSNINGNASYEKTTEIYYPSPIILSHISNTFILSGGTKEFYVSATNPNEIKDDELRYKWYVDNVLVQSNPIEAEWYDYTQTDNTEHTLKCEISNNYKTVTTEAQVGNVVPSRTIIKSLEGNKVIIYEDNNSTTYDVNSSGEVQYETIASTIDVSSQFTKNTVLTPLLFSRLFLQAVVPTKVLVDEKRIALNNFVFYRQIQLEERYPNLYRNSDDVTTMLQGANSNQDQYVDINEIHSLGLGLYDKNGDNKIQLKELKTYDDTSVTLNFALLKKNISTTDIDLSEDAFEEAFDNLPAGLKRSIVYPDNEYITANITLYNSPEQFTYQESESRIYSINNEITMDNDGYDNGSNTYTGEFSIKIHHPDINDKNITFILINDRTHESYFIQDINYSTPIRIDYALFHKQGKFNVNNNITGSPFAIIDNIPYQVGTIARDQYSDEFGKLALYDAVLAPNVGIYFNIDEVSSLNDLSREINSLYYFSKTFNDINYTNSLFSQYLAVDISQDTPVTYAIVNSANSEDLVKVDKIKHVYHGGVSENSFTTYSTSENAYVYIGIEEQSTIDIKGNNESVIKISILTDTMCQDLFGVDFCLGSGSNAVQKWDINFRLDVIDYLDNLKQENNASKRIKTRTKDEPYPT